MKNNEIMISTKFEFNNHKTQILSFLVLNDITLSALIEAIYYGLKNQRNMEIVSSFLMNISVHARNFKYYIRQRAVIVLLILHKR